MKYMTSWQKSKTKKNIYIHMGIYSNKVAAKKTICMPGTAAINLIYTECYSAVRRATTTILNLVSKFTETSKNHR